MAQSQIIHAGVARSRPRQITDVRIFQKMPKWIAELKKHPQAQVSVEAYEQLLVSIRSAADLSSIHEVQELFSQIASALFKNGYACKELIKDSDTPQALSILNVASESILAARLFGRGSQNEFSARDLHTALKEQRAACDTSGCEEFGIVIQREFKQHPLRSVCIALLLTGFFIFMALSQAWGI
jgi:hypothetical protein